MVPETPSSRARELIRQAARIALDPIPEWLDELDRATLSVAGPAAAEDPRLADVVSRANRANLAHFAIANLRNPGAPVRPNLGAETVVMARDLGRRGLDALVPLVYRIGQNVAWKRWSEIVFTLTSDPQDLRELLDIPFQTANDFVDATLANIAVRMPLRYDELADHIRAERRDIVETILDGSRLSLEHAETRLGYHLDRIHTAAVMWCGCDEPGADHSHLDRAAQAFSGAVDSPQSLTVFADDNTRWIWAASGIDVDSDEIHRVLSGAPEVRIAIGTTAPGIDGFRRSHLDALAVRHTMTRFRSRQRIALFTDIQLMALLSDSSDGVDHFVRATLGDFASASRVLQTTLLTYINQQCNASRTARHLYMHRNTLLSRLESAQRLLPRPLDETTVDVAVAIRLLQWRGDHTADPTEMPTEDDGNGASQVSQH